AGGAFGAGLGVARARRPVRAALADSLVEWALWRERRGRPGRDIAGRLAIYDDDGSRRARLQAPAALVVITDPPDARVAPVGRLAPGSHGILATAPGRAPVRSPGLLG